jgi:hypothetical protein
MDGRPVAARPLRLASRAWAWIKVHPFVAAALLFYAVIAVLVVPIGDDSTFSTVCAIVSLPSLFLLISISFDRKAKELRTATMRVQTAADEVPAAVLSLYVSRVKLLRWMTAGGFVGCILASALVPTNSSLSEMMFFIYWLAGAGVVAYIVASVRSRRR